METLTLQIIKKFRNNRHVRKDLLPRRLEDLFTHVRIINKRHLFGRNKLLAELFKKYYCIIAGGFASYICGLTNTFTDIDLFTLVLQEETEDTDSNQKETWYMSPNGRRETTIVQRTNTRLTSKIGRKIGPLIRIELIARHVGSREELEELYLDPFKFAEKCTETFDLEVCKCVGIPDKRGDNFIFFKIGEETSPDLTLSKVTEKELEGRNDYGSKETPNFPPFIQKFYTKRAQELVTETLKWNPRQKRSKKKLWYKSFLYRTAVRLDKYSTRVTAKHTKFPMLTDTRAQLRNLMKSEVTTNVQNKIASIYKRINKRQFPQ